MRLQFVRVRNFRSLEDLKFDCNRGLNVFVGPNNSGKSSILEVLRLVRDACGQYPFDSRGGFKQVVSRHDQDRNVEVTLEVSPFLKAQRGAVTIWMKAGI